MAHAAPAAGVTARRPLNPDIFDERVHRIAAWATPVALGLVYGYWAAANRRSGGPITGWNLLFGFVTTIAFIALYVGVRTLAARVPREVHALLWSGFWGAAFGFAYSQTDKTALRSSVMGLLIGASVFAVLFYRYYTREDAEGHRIR